MLMAESNTGILYGVGVGPGDPQLLTLLAEAILTKVQVIFVPQKSRDSDSIAESIILHRLPQVRHKIIKLTLPMLQERQKLQTHWDQAVKRIWQKLRTGRDCAFVNIGDPLLYGTFIYIMQEMQREHPEVIIKVVPGITSINAASARTLTPLASEEQSVAIICGKIEAAKIKTVLEQFDTVVFMKINRNMETLVSALEEMNLMQKSVFISKCTMDGEEIVVDLKQLKQRQIDYFSILIVRK